MSRYLLYIVCVGIVSSCAKVNINLNAQRLQENDEKIRLVLSTKNNLKETISVPILSLRHCQFCQVENDSNRMRVSADTLMFPFFMQNENIPAIESGGGHSVFSYPVCRLGNQETLIDTFYLSIEVLKGIKVVQIEGRKIGKTGEMGNSFKLTSTIDYNPVTFPSFSE